jgi:hypothetical protein
MAGAKPDYDVFVSQQSGGKNFYTKIGGAWRVEKEGISINLQALPVNGKMVLFPRRDDDNGRG